MHDAPPEAAQQVRNGDDASAVDPELKRIVARAVPGARVLSALTLGADLESDARQATAKSAGYGVPIRIDVELQGERRSLVLHGTSANDFGHDRRADRAAELLLAADTFASIPRHVRALEVGVFTDDGVSVPLSNTGEFYLLTDYAPGRAYAEDLRAISRSGAASSRDFDRMHTLVDYLAELHSSVQGRPAAYARSLRDLLGSGEGIFGIVDAYQAAPQSSLCRSLRGIERRCLEWRWRLKAHLPRATRIHGDFHPFNVLFDEPSDLHVLDTSRGSIGDPADDVSCMAVNYVFFAIEDAASWRAAFAPLWREFWSRYLAQTKDRELLSVAAPFLAWRLLVLACPVWYPNLSAAARARLLSFADAVLAAERFDPSMAEAVFA